MSDPAALARGIMLTGVTELTAPELTDFAGYVLFARNGESVASVRGFTDALRARYGETPPIVAIDQEGGTVARLREGIEPMPSMMALGATGDSGLAERAGEQTAFDLRRAGCTLDFAPVLDLALDPSNTVIGTRAFGSDPQMVAALGAAFAAGLSRGGIVPCFKHFPGHGATGVDSHEALPVIEADPATWRSRDLVPFAAVAPAAAAIMSAHVVVRDLDPQRPATLSPAIATDLLRRQLSFAGVLITDCLEMGALRRVTMSSRAESRDEGPREDDVSSTAVEALLAGVDLLLFSHHPDLAHEASAAIARAVEEGKLPLKRLEEAHARVTRLRNAGTLPLPLDAFPPHPNVGREIGRRAITLVRGIPEADPLASFAIGFGVDATALQHEAPALACVCAPVDPRPADCEEMLARLAQTGRRPLLLSNRAHLHPLQGHAIADVLQRYPDALVVSLREPYDLPLFGAARHLLAAYGDDRASIGGLADVLFGHTLPTGRLPIALSP